MVSCTICKILDDYNSTIGNPGLKPEINNNAEIGIEKKMEPLASDIWRI